MSDGEEVIPAAKAAALVVLSLDEETATEVLRHMQEADLVKLAKIVEELEPIPYESLSPALAQFEARLHKPVVSGKGTDYLRKLAAGALGADRARSLFAPPKKDPPNSIAVLAQAKATTLADLLSREHPQVAAAILSQLEGRQAARIIEAMDEDQQADVVGRIAQIEEIPRSALEIASDSLRAALEELSSGDGHDEEFSGVKFAATMLNELSSDDSERLLESLEEFDETIGPKIREAMFTFEDLMTLDKRAMQALMREIPSDSLLVALRTAGESLREIFFGAVSQRAAESMREDLELMPPKRLSEVEEAQKEIVEIAMRLASDGQITMSTSGSEEMV